MKTKGFEVFLFLVAVPLVSVFGCIESGPQREAYLKDGKEYGVVRGAFRHRWWNYYERGLSFGEGEFFEEAAADLKEAIRQREKDQRMARTYGMHFIDYFPHRELGIVYYETGRLLEAENELELSLSQFPSSKARFYLDRVRKALMERGKTQVPPPKISLDFKTDQVWTREDPVKLCGIAEDDHYVSGITIRGIPLFFDGARKKFAFEESLKLPQGRHVVEITATNLLGKSASNRVVIHVDREGPVITIDQLKTQWVSGGKIVTISGSVYDPSGLSSVLLGGNPVEKAGNLEIFFQEAVTTQREQIDLEATDRLGNKTRAEIKAPSHSASQKPLLLAGRDPVMNPMIFTGIFGRKDKNPPDINLKGWTDTQTVYLDKVYIEGQITDEGKIESLTINRVPALRRKGQCIIFNHLAQLIEGENRITIEAKDEANNRATREIDVIREVPQALQLEERLSMTVMPFEQRSSLSERSTVFQDFLISALVERNRFRIVERDRLDMILQEQKLSQTELIEKRTALRLGKLIAAQSVMTGSIIETRNGMEIVARLVDTETSEILATKDVYDETKDANALKTLAEGMAIKFHREFPLLEGMVIMQKGKHIFTDLGKDKIKLLRRLIVYREEPITHPITGKVLGADNIILTRAKISQVMQEMSKAEIVDEKSVSINRLDRVITE